MVEEALVPGGVRLRSLREVVQEPKLPAGDLRRERPGDHAVLGDHREAGEGQAVGGDAARSGRVGLVPDQAVVGVRLVQVVQDRGPLELVKLLVGRPVVTHRSSASLT